MKNKILYGCTGLAFTMMMGCNAFLDTDSYTLKNGGNFPQTEDDVLSMVAGAYAAQNDYDKTMMTLPYFIAEYASDERLGSGGAASTANGYDKLMVRGDTEFDGIWELRYKGIYRANMIIEDIDKVTFRSQALRDQYLGEAYFLRAIYYWDLCQMFETVPLTTSTEAKNRGKASVDELYAQMGSDLIKAIELLPNKAYNTYKSGQGTRWAAEGYLGRIYLFYCGMYKDNNLDAGMPLTKGETLTKDKMVSYIEDCINNSGHALVPNYCNLWTYANEYTQKDWQASQDMNLQWAGENNTEVMYMYKYSLLVNTGNNLPQRNYIVLNQGFAKPDLNQTFPYGSGWGVGAVVPYLWEEWEAAEPNDIRRWASIVNIREEMPTYDLTNPKHVGNGVEMTYFKQKKFLPITAKAANGSVQFSFCVQKWGAMNNLSKANIEDFPLMRFSEIHLMHSELTGTATGMNVVRNRAGLEDTTYSLENLQNERRWELSFEGLRWNDIRRWGLAETLIAKQVGVELYNDLVKTTMPNTFGGGYVARYQQTRGFFMIPPSQVDISGGLLKQNKGWEPGDNFLYSGWQ